MNREILFKGWHEFKGNGEWVYGFYFKHPPTETNPEGLSAIFIPSEGSRIVIPESVSQYTGYDDYNGVKVFGNDILQWYDSETNHKSSVSSLAATLLGFTKKYNDYPILSVGICMKRKVIWKNGGWFMDIEVDEDFDNYVYRKYGDTPVSLNQLFETNSSITNVGNAWKEPDILSGRMYIQKNRYGNG